MKRFCTLCVATLLLLAPATSAQRLYGLDGPAATAIEFNSAPAGPCAAPIPSLTTWLTMVPPPCPGPPLGPSPGPGPGSFGDIAVDRLTDTIYVTDGFIIEQYADASPVTATAPGTPLNSFFLPPVGLGPLNGMGFDSAGVVAGIPALYVTDGFLVMGIAPSPPGSCAPPLIVVPPFPSPFPGPILTDISVDPSTGSLLACDSVGMVQSFFAGGAPGPWAIIPVSGTLGCGLGPLEGIAVDLATTPSLLGLPPSYYVTDGVTVAYVLAAGGPAPATFYTPLTCWPAPAPITGLAYAAHSNNFAGAPGTATLTSYGQSSSPGPTYGVVVSGIPGPAFLWLLIGVNIPGPGFFCPPLTAVGNPLYVDFFTPPGLASGLFVTPGPTAVLPLPIAPGVPPGIEFYVQVFLDLTPAGPGGPWLATDPLNTVFTAP